MPPVSTRKPPIVTASPSRPAAGPKVVVRLGGKGAGGSRVDGAPFEQAAATVLGDFQHALADLVATSPAEIGKIADVEQAFGINHLLAWQVFRIVNAQNPLAAGMHVPARVSMKKLLTAAARRKAPAEIIERVSEAFEAFERLVKAEAGDREEMEAMLSSFIPEERRKQDLASRQAAFKGMSQIKGVATECGTATFVCRPSGDGVTVDRAIVTGEFGMRRLRPEARVVVGTGDVLKPDSSITTLDGSVPVAPLGSLLGRFSTSPLPRMESREIEGMVCYRVAGDDIAMRSAIDVVTADRRNKAMPAFHEEGAPRYRGYAHVVSTPVKRLTVDIFVHRDAYPGVVPRLRVYDTSRFGFVSKFDDPAREDDLLDTQDDVRLLPAGLTGARLTHVPRYLELLEYAFEKLGWDAAEFRGYRLDVQYPVYSAVYMLGFELPERPVDRGL